MAQELAVSELLLTGKSQKTIKRNVVRPFRRLLYSLGYREEDVRYSMMGGELEFTVDDRDVLVYLVALKDESSQDDIQGMTVAGLDIVTGKQIGRAHV